MLVHDGLVCTGFGRCVEIYNVYAQLENGLVWYKKRCDPGLGVGNVTCLAATKGWIYSAHDDGIICKMNNK